MEVIRGRERDCRQEVRSAVKGGGTRLRTPVALVLSHDPHNQCGVEVMAYRSQS
jgi:hypothetical protein